MTARRVRLFHKIQITARRLQKRADREIAATGPLTTAQAAVLSILEAGEGRTQRAVAEIMDQNESAITAMVRRLAALGFLERERDPDDRRAMRLRLTNAGRMSLAATREPFSRINAIVDSTFSTDEIERFAEYLTRLHAALGGTHGEPR
ncbi:MAG: MarR family transcriptional regulator [Pseudomonadota bacterium]